MRIQLLGNVMVEDERGVQAHIRVCIDFIRYNIFKISKLHILRECVIAITQFYKIPFSAPARKVVFVELRKSHKDVRTGNAAR